MNAQVKRQGLRLGVDLMGSESTPSVFFEALTHSTQQLSEGDTVVAFASPTVIQEFHSSAAAKDCVTSRLQFEPCEQVIKMEDSPLTAIRRKKESSMLRGMTQLRDQQIDALISAGNTGALIASGTIMLPMLPGVERTALLALLPTRQGYVAVVDVGGNVSVKPHHLLQFAKMGAAYLRSRGVVRSARVGLLNIGEESKKGTPEAQQAFELLGTACQEEAGRNGGVAMEFLGNIEGREVFQGKVDVLVTDGFTGNIFLKTSEGVSHFILDYLQDAFAEDPDPRLDNVIKTLQGIVNYDEYPGAIVTGVDRILIKCHGCSSARAISKGILGARDLLEHQWLSVMRKQLFT